MAKGIVILSVFILLSCTDGSQQADPNFVPQNKVARVHSEAPPLVLIDQAHHNFHTMNGRYQPFAQVLRSDGYLVEANTKAMTPNVLKDTSVLVIANALGSPSTNWQPPFLAAFTHDEIDVIANWVAQGGALLLIADHTPFPIAIDDLASEFGFQFSHGHVNDYLYQRQDGSLAEHVITTGSPSKVKASLPTFAGNFTIAKEINQVMTFGGSAFIAPDNAQVLLKITQDRVSLEPDIPFKIDGNTRRVNVKGWSQGAVMEFGQGRVAVFAEAMMFSSQLDPSTGQKHGFRSVGAEQNEAFLLNLMYWLSSED